MKVEIIDLEKAEYFDVILGDGIQENTTGFKHLAQLLFDELPHRNLDSEVIISHLGEKMVHIKLSELRGITLKLFRKFQKNKIKTGDTVFLASVEVNSELYTAILFMALAGYGIKVFLPMYIEHANLHEWYKKTAFDFIIIPETEVFQLPEKTRQKEVLQNLKNFAATNEIPTIDTFTELQIDALVETRKLDFSVSDNNLSHAFYKDISPEDIALLITTSGSSGESKIVAYDHESFLINLSAWKYSGLFSEEKLGGRSFTPLFTHTMGIRTFMNGLYLGRPIILINTDWFTERPEAVQYFLATAKPEHITGGPAVFRLMLEMSRIFPDLKRSFRKNLKTLVSCGADLDEEIKFKIFEAFNLKVGNALGTTETQQVTSTVIEDLSAQSLGTPFPGVSLGLKKRGNKNDYMLYILSSYGGSWVLQDELVPIKNKYIYLGDIVSFKNDQLFYCQREQQDYINDEFGVKIVLDKVLENYEKLKEHCFYIKFLPLKFKPGLTALIFLNLEETDTESNLLYLKGLIESINEQLYNTLDPLDFQHKTIKRFAVCKSTPVLNTKGEISENKISRVHSDLIKQLTSDNLSTLEITELKEYKDEETGYTKFHNPYIGKMLSTLKMDISYQAAEGDYLISRDKEKDRKILDLTGGYGTNLLGHYNKRIRNYAIEFLKSKQIPLSDQFSNQYYPSKLAEKINLLLSKYTGKSFFTLFGSTGSEVVEMAIHHAYLEWKEKLKKLEEKQRLEFSFLAPDAFRETWSFNNQIIERSKVAMISNKMGYHGTSSSARSLMGNKENRSKFQGLLNILPIFIDDSSQHLERQLSEALEKNVIELQILKSKTGDIVKESFKFSVVIGAILEPVLGEGGIREMNPALPELLSKNDFPIIFDEIQCGLGRTGSFLASENFDGHYYLFSKALGGNIEKVASISIDKNRYREEFGKFYLSTFSGGAFGTSIALESLKIIEDENIPDKARIKGEEIKTGLEHIKTKYPGVLLSINGRGLMLGLKFNTFKKEIFLRVLQENKQLGYLLSSYLLNRHQLRILPSLSAPDVLRIEPSVNIKKKDLEKLLTAVEDIASLIEKEDFFSLVKHLINDDPFNNNKNYIPEHGFLNSNLEIPEEEAVSVAFIVHFAYPTEELRMLSRSLTAASDTGLWQLYEKLATVLDLKPFVSYSKNLYKGKINLCAIVIPIDAASMEKSHRTSKKRRIVESIQEAVDLAANRGATIISLGGYTSILTNNGKSILEPENSRVVTGNTFTAVVGYNNFKKYVLENISNNKLKIGVVGAAGNIGKILCRNLVNEDELSIAKVVLIGKSSGRLKKYVDEFSLHSTIELSADTSLTALIDCDAILVAVNTNDPIVNAGHIARNKPVVISDLSVPAAVSADLKNLSNVSLAPFSASIKLPYDPEVVLTSCSPPGTSLCCLAESFLYAFEDIPTNLRGDITYEGFQIVERIAKKNGFIGGINSAKNFKSTW